jgi:hypothetical protein
MVCGGFGNLSEKMRYTVKSLAIVVATMLLFSCGEKRSPETSSVADWHGA